MNLLSIHLFLQPLTFNVYSQHIQTLFSQCYSAQITDFFFSSDDELNVEGRGEEPLISFTHCNTTPSPSKGRHWPTDASDSQWWYTPGGKELEFVCCWRNPQCSGNVFLMKEIEDNLLKPLVRHQVENAYEYIFNYVTAFYQTFSAFWKTTKTIWTFKIFVR